MSAHTIRLATPADFETLLELFEAFAAGESARDARHAFAPDARRRYANDLREWLRSDAHAVFLAEQAGEGVGFQTAALWYNPPLYEPVREAFLGEVYVVPKARRQGVATALVGAAREWAEARGAVRLRTVLLAANAPSVALWEGLGARPLAHVYTLELNAAPAPEARPHKLGFGA